MHFTVEGKQFLDALNDIKRALGSIEHVSMSVTDKLYLGGTNKVCQVQMTLSNVQVESEGNAMVPLETLLGVVKSRKMITFELHKNTLAFSSSDNKSYRGEIVSLPYEPITIDMDSAVTKLNMSTKLVQSFYKCMAAVTLQGSYNNKNPLPIYTSIGPEGIHAICYDNFHLASIKMTGIRVKKAYTLCLLPSVLSTIETLAKGSAFSLVLGTATVIASNEHFSIQQPLIQVDGDANDVLTNLQSFIDETKTHKSTQVTVLKDKFRVIFDNAMAFYSDQGVSLGIMVTPKGMDLRVKTSYGSVKEVLAGTSVTNPSKSIFKCEMSVLEELLGKLSVDSLTFSFIEDSALYIEHEAEGVQVFYSASLRD